MILNQIIRSQNLHFAPFGRAYLGLVISLFILLHHVSKYLSLLCVSIAMRKIRLKDERWGKNEYHTLDAVVNETGDLVLEGYDAGDSVKERFDDFDFEYWHTIKAEDVPQVLLLLVKEKITDKVHEFLAWLEENDIPYKSTSF